VSPNNADQMKFNNKRVNQSMGVGGKIGKYQTVASGFNLNTSAINSGVLVELKGTSTPIKSHSIAHPNAFNSKGNRENINLSRANLDSSHI
jgi:hypothetical protein